MIHIAYCLDNGYAEPTCVSMASVLANTRSKVLFHIVYRKLSELNKSRIEQLCDDFENVECLFYNINIDKYLENLVLQKNIHVTIETYFRLFLHLIIKNTNRLIYIDGDTVVNDDIQKLWDENLQGKTVGAVKDIKTRDTKEVSEIMGFDIEKYYFNAGVLLIDLERYASVFSIDIVLPELGRLYEKFLSKKVPWYADQDILNYIANGNSEVCLLPAKYNLYQNDFEKYFNHIPYGQYCRTLEEWKVANTEPVIIHFIASYKPWKVSRRIKYTDKYELYFKYKNLTPYKSRRDMLVLVEYERRRKVTRTQAVMDSTMFVSLFWKDILNDAAQIAKQKVNGRKIAIWGAGKHMKYVVSVFAFNDLIPTILVDGFEKKLGQQVFEYTVKSPDKLLECPKDYFIVLSMETIQGRNAVLKILKENGFTEQDFVIAYKEVFDFEEELIV